MLNKAKLTSSLAGILNNPDGISSRSDAEVRWARAYHSYAQDAEDVSGDRVVSANEAGFFSTLSFSSDKSPIEAAKNYDDAFVTYWTGGIFAIGLLVVAPKCPNVGGNGVWSTEVTSVVVSVASGVLSSLLAPIFSGLSDGDTGFSKASQVANAFHVATTTAVTVLISGLDTTPGPLGPLPISNTCTIG